MGTIREKSELSALKDFFEHMTEITLKFTATELELLRTLAEDQLFRREFIDRRLPGYQANIAELNLGKQLVERLRRTIDQATHARTPEKEHSDRLKTQRARAAARSHDAV